MKLTKSEATKRLIGWFNDDLIRTDYQDMELRDYEIAVALKLKMPEYVHRLFKVLGETK